MRVDLWVIFGRLLARRQPKGGLPACPFRDVKNGNGAHPRMRSALTSTTDMLMMMKFADPLLWNIRLANDRIAARVPKHLAVYLDKFRKGVAGAFFFYRLAISERHDANHAATRCSLFKRNGPSGGELRPLFVRCVGRWASGSPLPRGDGDLCSLLKRGHSQNQKGSMDDSRQTRYADA